MTHLKIEQNEYAYNLSAREQVSSALIKKLYDIVTDPNNVLDGTSHLKGFLNVDSTYQDYIDALTDSTKDLTKDMDITATKVYLRFTDQTVLNTFLNAGIGDGVGITQAEASAITALPNALTSAFRNNTSITSLDDLRYFGLTTLNSTFAMEATNLTSVTTPSTLTQLSVYGNNTQGTFRGCTSLTSVTLNEGLLRIENQAFHSCTSLQTIDIPSTVQSLSSDGTYNGWGTFANCTALTSVTGGENISILGSNTFGQCSNLQSIGDIDISNLIYIGSDCFAGCSKLELGSVTLSSDITTIHVGAFKGCQKLTSISMPNVTIIENPNNFLTGGFYECRGLTTVVSPSLQQVAYMSFRYCDLLSSIDLSNVTNIGVCAFQSCFSLTSVNLSSCTQILDGAFNGCTGLQSVTMPSSGSVTIAKEAFKGCSSLTSIDLSNVTSFGNGCFQGCSSLGVGVDLDFNLDGKTFSANCFRGTGYRSITLHETSYHQIFNFSGSGQYGTFGAAMPNLIKLDLSDTKQTSMGQLYSDSLTTIILPETYTDKPNRGTDWGRSLLYVVILSTTPTSNMEIPSYVFSNLNQSSIYVPDSAYQDYYDVLITNSSTPISSTRLKRISELPSSVTWYTKEHPTTT